MNQKFFGKRLALKRKEKGISQQKLADLLDVKSGTVGGYETGKSYPSADVLVKIAQILDCSIDYLLLNKEDNVDFYTDSEDNIRPLNRGTEYELKECRKELLSLKELIESYKSNIESDKVTIETQKRYIAILEQQLRGLENSKTA